MLINPFQDTRASTERVQGTRIVTANIGGILGHTIPDHKIPERVWYIERILAPLPGRSLGGIRTKLVDNKGFVTFINQRDLEVLLGIGKPGEPCLWWTGTYPLPYDYVDGWFGMCVDQDDKDDDMQERELWLRSAAGWGVLPDGMELMRRLHSDGVDTEEQMYLRGDRDPETWSSPDMRLETITGRWVPIGRTRLDWRRV